MLAVAVPEALAGTRLDAALQKLGNALSRRTARLLCESGAVAVEGVVATASQRVHLGERIQYRPETLAATEQLRLAVVFADADLIIVHKPPDFAVHAGPLVPDSVAARLETAFPGAGLAQRLDRGASGLLLIGLHKEALRNLATAMEQGAIAREYLAVAHGSVTGTRRTIDLPLRVTDEPRGNQPKVIVDQLAGQPARTHVEALEHLSWCTLLSVALDTGRTHQIRAHLAAIGHPLIGDPRYGDAAANERARTTHGITRPLLHATRLHLPHPRTGEPLTATAFHEPDFARLFGGQAFRTK